MSGHPCRAHHKLKWVRKMQSGIKVLYKQVPRSESSKTIVEAKFRCPLKPLRLPNSNGSTLFGRCWQQPLDHNEAQPVHRVKDAEGTAKPLVLDSARWLCYPRNHPVTLRHIHISCTPSNNTAFYLLHNNCPFHPSICKQPIGSKPPMSHRPITYA